MNQTAIITQPEEIARRTELESIIEAGRQTFIEVGNALQEICDAQLYRWTHRTFKEYCEEKWGMGKSQAYRIMEAALLQKKLANVLASKDLSPIGDIPNENVARNLAKLPHRTQVAIAIEASKTDGKITEESVSRAKGRQKHTTKPRIPDPFKFHSEPPEPIRAGTEIAPNCVALMADSGESSKAIHLMEPVSEPAKSDMGIPASQIKFGAGPGDQTTVEELAGKKRNPILDRPTQERTWNRAEILAIIDGWWLGFKPRLAYTSVSIPTALNELKNHIGKI